MNSSVVSYFSAKFKINRPSNKQQMYLKTIKKNDRANFHYYKKAPMAFPIGMVDFAMLSKVDCLLFELSD